MKPSAFSDTRSKKSEKYNCFVVCKDMRQSFYLLKVDMLWEVGSITKSKTESEILGSFTNSYEFKRPLSFKRFPYITQNFTFRVTDTKTKKVLGTSKFSFTPKHTKEDFMENLPIINENESQVGTIQVVFSKVETVVRDFVALELVGKDIKNVDFAEHGDKSDPFLVFHRFCNNTYVPVFCTDAIMDNLNPKWERVILSLDELSNNNPDNPIKIECWDWQEDLRYQFIGDTETTLRELFTKPTLTLQARNPKTKTGEVIVKVVKKLIKPSIADFLTSEDKFAFVLGVDFSVYNRSPYNNRNLHEIDKKGSSSYLRALEEISKIMWGKDTDGRIPCFGFGGRPNFPEYTKEGHDSLIPLSGNKHKMSILSPEHLIEAYKNARTYIDPMENVNFIDLLKLVREWANRDQKNKLYYVLVILTAGHVEDLQATIDILVDIAHLPISIVLVGVGNHDFSLMEKLDGDKKWLRNSKKKLTKRDIVNFVDFEECADDPEKLLKKILEEFPEQFMSYKTHAGYKVDGVEFK